MIEQNIFQLDISLEILKPIQFCVGGGQESVELLHETNHLLYLYFIAKGSGIARSKRENCTFHDGDVLCVFPGKSCTFSMEEKGSKWYWISVEIGNNVDFGRWGRIEKDIALLQRGITKPVAYVLDELEKEQETGKERPYLVTGMIYTLMDEFYKVSDEMKEGAFGGRDSRSVALAVQYIAENYYHKIDVEAVCRYVNYSRYYFSRSFKSIQGISIMEYINKVRLERAVYLLIHTDLTVAEVAKSVGFDDPYYFSKKFKIYTGVAPSSFKETCQEKDAGGISDV